MIKQDKLINVGYLTRYQNTGITIISSYVQTIINSAITTLYDDTELRNNINLLKSQYVGLSKLTSEFLNRNQILELVNSEEVVNVDTKALYIYIDSQISNINNVLNSYLHYYNKIIDTGHTHYYSTLKFTGHTHTSFDNDVVFGGSESITRYMTMNNTYFRIVNPNSMGANTVYYEMAFDETIYGKIYFMNKDVLGVDDYGFYFSYPIIGTKLRNCNYWGGNITASTINSNSISATTYYNVSASTISVQSEIFSDILIGSDTVQEALLALDIHDHSNIYAKTQYFVQHTGDTLLHYTTGYTYHSELTATTISAGTIIYPNNIIRSFSPQWYHQGTNVACSFDVIKMEIIQPFVIGNVSAFGFCVPNDYRTGTPLQLRIRGWYSGGEINGAYIVQAVCKLARTGFTYSYSSTTARQTFLSTGDSLSHREYRESQIFPILSDSNGQISGHTIQHNDWIMVQFGRLICDTETSDIDVVNYYINGIDVVYFVDGP